MEKEKFIQIQTASQGPITIAISQISSVKPAVHGSKIILKEIKDGQNIEIDTSWDYGNIINQINKLME